MKYDYHFTKTEYNLLVKCQEMAQESIDGYEDLSDTMWDINDMLIKILKKVEL